MIQHRESSLTIRNIPRFVRLCISYGWVPPTIPVVLKKPTHFWVQVNPFVNKPVSAKQAVLVVVKIPSHTHTDVTKEEGMTRVEVSC